MLNEVEEKHWIALQKMCDGKINREERERKECE